MARIKARRLGDGSWRWDVHYSHHSRSVSVTFDDVAEAEGYAHVVDLRHRRCWPVAALVERSGLTARRLAEVQGLGRHGADDARRRGLTDVQADRWATAAGLHPVEVWGWAWVTAAQPAPTDGEAVA